MNRTKKSRDYNEKLISKKSQWRINFVVLIWMIQNKIVQLFIYCFSNRRCSQFFCSYHFSRSDRCYFFVFYTSFFLIIRSDSGECFGKLAICIFESFNSTGVKTAITTFQLDWIKRRRKKNFSLFIAPSEHICQFKNVPRKIFRHILT